MTVQRRSAFFRISLSDLTSTRMAGAHAPVLLLPTEGRIRTGRGPGRPWESYPTPRRPSRQPGPDVSYITLPQDLTPEPRGAWGTGWAVSRCASQPGPAWPDPLAAGS